MSTNTRPLPIKSGTATIKWGLNLKKKIHIQNKLKSFKRSLKRNPSKRGDTGYVVKFDQDENRSKAPGPRLIYKKTQINHENLIYWQRNQKIQHLQCLVAGSSNRVVVPIGASVLIVSAIEPAEGKQSVGIYRSFVRANLQSLTSSRCCESILFVLCDFRCGIDKDWHRLSDSQTSVLPCCRAIMGANRSI